MASGDKVVQLGTRFHGPLRLERFGSRGPELNTMVCAGTRRGPCTPYSPAKETPYQLPARGHVPNDRPGTAERGTLVVGGCGSVRTGSSGSLGTVDPPCVRQRRLEPRFVCYFRAAPSVPGPGAMLTFAANLLEDTASEMKCWSKQAKEAKPSAFGYPNGGNARLAFVGSAR